MMIPRLARVHLLFGLLLAVPTNAINYSFDSSRCVSPSGYNACVTPVESQSQDCLNKAGTNQNEIQACASTTTLFQLNCIYENCWNIVYDCEVQQLASLTAQSFGVAGIPYYPAPGNAPGGCSCNLEEVEQAFYGSLDDTVCLNSDISYQICECCAQAGAYAGLYSVCPSVDPQFLLDTLPGGDSLLSVLTPSFNNCEAILQQNNCETVTGFGKLPGSLTYLSTLPVSTGTASYSDRSGALSQPSAAVISYTLQNGIELTATAVQATITGTGRVTSTNAVNSPTSAARTGTGTSVTSSASQSTGATSSPAPKNGATMAAGAPPVSVIAIIVLVALVSYI